MVFAQPVRGRQRVPFRVQTAQQVDTAALPATRPIPATGRALQVTMEVRPARLKLRAMASATRGSGRLRATRRVHFVQPADTEALLETS